MNNTVLGEISDKVEGYDREKVVATITMNLTARELNMLELALHQHYRKRMDNDIWHLLSKDLSDAEAKDMKLNAWATYYMLTKIESLNKEIKSRLEVSDGL